MSNVWNIEDIAFLQIRITKSTIAKLTKRNRVIVSSLFLVLLELDDLSTL
jgi:hypothetical protein